MLSLYLNMYYRCETHFNVLSILLSQEWCQNTTVTSVGTTSAQRFTSGNTSVFIQERSRTTVTSVGRTSVKKLISWDISVFIQERSHTNVTIVERASVGQIISRHTSMFIQERSSTTLTNGKFTQTRVTETCIPSRQNLSLVTSAQCLLGTQITLV